MDNILNQKYKNKKLIIVLMLLALSVCFVFATTFSYMFDQKESIMTITTGDVGIKLEEDFPENVPETGATDINKKIFWGVANGSKDTVVRTSITPMIEYRLKNSTDWISYGGQSMQDGIDYKISDATKQNWTKSKDSDYWYYNKVLFGNNTGKQIDGKVWENNNLFTSKFEINDINLEIKKDELPEELKDADFRLNLLVNIENSQYSHNMAIKNWNLTGNDKEIVEKIKRTH